MGALGQVQPWMRIPSHFQALSLCRIPFSSLTWLDFTPRAVPLPRNPPWLCPPALQQRLGCPHLPAEFSWMLDLPSSPIPAALASRCPWTAEGSGDEGTSPGKQPRTSQSRRSSSEAEQIQCNQNQGFSGLWRHSSSFDPNSVAAPTEGEDGASGRCCHGGRFKPTNSYFLHISVIPFVFLFDFLCVVHGWVLLSWI